MKKQKIMKSENFSKNLIEIIDTLGMSQNELARRSGITAAGVSQIIVNKREPRLNTAIKIVSALNTTFDRMLR